MPLAGDYSAVMTEPAAKPETLFPSPQRDTPKFDAQFQGRLEDLIHWRRDVRRFRADPVEDALIDDLIGLATRSPSVGNSQPWQFVEVTDPGRRADVIKNFEACNADALADYEGAQAQRYATLKLAGLKEATVPGCILLNGNGRRAWPRSQDDAGDAVLFRRRCGQHAVAGSTFARARHGLGIDHRAGGDYRNPRCGAGMDADRLPLHRLSRRRTLGPGTEARRVAAAARPDGAYYRALSPSPLKRYLVLDHRGP